MNKNQVMKYGKEVRDLIGATADIDKLLQAIKADQMNGERGTLSLEYEGRNGNKYRPADRAIYAKYRRVACDIFGNNSGNLGLLYRLMEQENSSAETYQARASLIDNRLMQDYINEMRGDIDAIVNDLCVFISEITLKDFPQIVPAPVIVAEYHPDMVIKNGTERTLAAYFTLIAHGAGALGALTDSPESIKLEMVKILEAITRAAYRVMNQEPPERYEQIPQTLFTDVFRSGIEKADFIISDKDGTELTTPYYTGNDFKAMIEKKCLAALPPIMKEPADKLLKSISAAFLEAHYPKDGKIVISLEDYCDKCKIDISAERAYRQAKYTIRRFLQAFKTITWSANRPNGDYIECSFVADHAIISRKNGTSDIVIWLAPNYCAAMRQRNAITLIPRKLYGLSDHTAPGKKSCGKAYTLGTMLFEHAYMYSNIQRGTNDILSVKSILKALEIDDYSVDSIKKWNSRIRTPIESALKCLEDNGLLKEYTYSKEKHQLLTDKELYELENGFCSFEFFESLYIDYKVNEIPPQIMERVNERKKAAAAKKALDAAAVIDAKEKVRNERRKRNAAKKQHPHI